MLYSIVTPPGELSSAIIRPDGTQVRVGGGGASLCEGRVGRAAPSWRTSVGRGVNGRRSVPHIRSDSFFSSAVGRGNGKYASHPAIDNRTEMKRTISEIHEYWPRRLVVDGVGRRRAGRQLPQLTVSRPRSGQTEAARQPASPQAVSYTDT